MVMVIKNIIATDTVDIKINKYDFETSSNKFETFFETIGSTTTAAILYIKSKVEILIMGIAVIMIKIKRPIIPIPFFNIAEDPITVSTASDKNPPTIGMKRSTANLAVRMVIPSIFVEIP